MSKDLNQCNFIGRLGKPPEIKYTASGDAVCNFSIACSDDYKAKSGEMVDQTNWINIVVWRKLAEICGQYLHKGSKVFISGKQVTRSWEGTNGKQYMTEIIANEMIMLDTKGEGQSQQQAPQGQTAHSKPSAPVAEPVDDGFDEIPF